MEIQFNTFKLRRTQLSYLVLVSLYFIAAINCLIVNESVPTQEISAVGIDIGPLTSSVSIFMNGSILIIPNEQGNTVTPSIIAFTDEGIFVGEEAKTKTKGIIVTMKMIQDMIGRSYDDEEVQNYVNQFPNFFLNKNGQPLIEIELNNTRLVYSPEEIEAILIKKLKQMAEMHLGFEIKQAIFSVPNYFNDNQRQARKQAATLAGLETLRIVNNPAAAAIAYELSKLQGEKNYIVFDFGGQLEVALINIDFGMIEIAAQKSSKLSGSDFDQRIVEFFVESSNKIQKEEIIESSKKMELIINKQTLELLSKAEQAKIQLSSEPQVNAELQDEETEFYFSETINRVKFEQLCNDILDRMVEPIEQVLAEANMTREQIDDVILVGGASNIPSVQAIIHKFFRKNPLKSEIKLDEVVAHGLATIAGILSSQQDHYIPFDLALLSLGIETAGGIFTKIIPRSTILPTKKSQVFTTYYDYQQTLALQIYQGERALVQDNHLIGQFDFNEIKPAKKGIAQIEVTLEMDVNFNLQVHALDLNTQRSQSFNISADQILLKNEEIQAVITDAEKYYDLDTHFFEQLETTTTENDYFEIISKYKAKIQEQDQGEEANVEGKESIAEETMSDLTQGQRNIVMKYMGEHQQQQQQSSKDDL